MAINWKEVLRKVRMARDFEEAREIVANEGITSDTLILRDDWKDALRVRAYLYNPADKGSQGKIDEQEYRLSLLGGQWIRWSFFRAHAPGQSDTFGDERKVEMKTGAGDWYVAEGSYDIVLKKIARSSKKLRWQTSEFTIVCTYAELCEYLASYKGKGLSAWFPQSKSAEREGTTLLRMQEWKNSRVKVAFLQKCPYCK